MTEALSDHYVPDAQPRVLVVENDARTALLHQRNLERWGYQAVLAEGTGEALLADAKQKAHDYACHVALVDMHLIDDYDEQDKSGLNLVPKLKPTLSIIVSGSGNDRATVLEALNKEAINFVGKEEPLANLKEALDKAAQQMYCTKSEQVIEIADSLVTQIMQALAPGKPEQVRGVLKALFPQAQTIRVELLDGSTRTPSFNVRRESYVLKIKVDALQPFAVKLASPNRIAREFTNYKDHIEHRLAHNCYAQIVNCVQRWHIAGISYVFLGGSLESFTRFSEYYAHKNAADICKTISHLFQTVWNPHISQQRKATTRSLFDAFSLCWNRAKWLERLDAYLRNLPGEKPVDAYIGEFLDPVHWVKKRTGDFGRELVTGDDATARLGELTEAIGHGDLQGDNFFVNVHAEARVIDYERTGYGPVIQDFVLLEFDIWARQTVVNDPGLFLHLLCFHLIQVDRPRLKLGKELPNEGEIEKASKSISRLRRLAMPLVPDPRIYLWGVLLNAVFRLVLLEEKLATIQKTDTYRKLFQERDRTLLVGAVLCRRLDDWGQTWPPPEWRLYSAAAEEPPEVTKQTTPRAILFLTAAPPNYPLLQVEEELHLLEQLLAVADYKEPVTLKAHGAVRLNELRRFLLKNNPRILHFAGHGNEQGEIIVKNELGHSIAVPADALGEMFTLLCEDLRCVILNACYTAEQAEPIAALVDAVIVMGPQIEDQTAIAFSKGFYEACLANRPLLTSFQSGINEIKLQRLPGDDIPKLLCPRINPATFYLL